MFRFRWFGGFCLFALSLSQTSCVVESVEPLSDPATSELDSRLFGQWKGKEYHGNWEHYLIGRPYENSIKDCPRGLTIVHTFRGSAKNEISADQQLAYFFVTKIGNDAYIDWCAPKDRKPLKKWNRADVEGFLPIKYSVAQDSLTIWLMDPDATAKVVESGKLKGEVKRGQTTVNVLLKDSTENLVKFLAGGGNQTLFSDKQKLVLTRVK